MKRPDGGSARRQEQAHTFWPQASWARTDRRTAHSKIVDNFAFDSTLNIVNYRKSANKTKTKGTLHIATFDSSSNFTNAHAQITRTHLFGADVQDFLLRALPAGKTGPARVQVKVGALALRHGAPQVVRRQNLSTQKHITDLDRLIAHMSSWVCIQDKYRQAHDVVLRRVYMYGSIQGVGGEAGSRWSSSMAKRRSITD